ncbi:MAG TPA: family 20 glycosylhydrolase [Pyrinomonadaceae bacterium]|nr:family 20 glycosylhydrolase [Pyrinomonadaceae bacterium]
MQRMKTLKHALLSALLLLATAPDFRAQETRPAPAVPSPRHNLMPVPASLRILGGRMKVEPTFNVAVQGHSDARLLAGIRRAVARLERRTGFEFARDLAEIPAAANLVIQCRGAGPETPELGQDESYVLEVSERQAFVNSATVVGAVRGLETFLQLVTADGGGYFVPEARIHDKPRFPWRGLLIDAGRHWQPLEVIKRNLDGMAAVKLNVLHWHLTDDQGFRVESKVFPRLHTLGSDGDFYTQEQIREVVAYAAERGIRVVPEFDVPGHSTSWFVGHPELATAPGPYQIERRYGIFDAAMDPTREETYRFLDRFLGEMAALFPDAYLHVGGDEVTGKHWRLSPQVQVFMSKHNLKDKQALQAHFNLRVSRIVQKHGKKMVGWDEILHPDLPRETVVQSWRGPQSLAEGAKQGYQGFLSNGYYLDHLLPASTLYLVDPLPEGSTLTAEEAARVLGGEACMWSEYVGPENIDSRIWPRLAAVAERLWSPREVRDVDDMYRRLEATAVQLEELGLTHRTYAGKMLRRLAGGEETKPLETLVGVLRPTFFEREKVRPITQQTPLTRLVDAAAPDPRAAREFASAVAALVDDAPRFQSRRERVRAFLEEWRGVQPAVRVLADRSPLMRDAVPLADSLSEMGAVGLEALQYLSHAGAPPLGWREERLALLERVARTPSEVDFPILPALRQLVHAAAEQTQLRTLTAAEWKARVLKLAEEKK